MVIKFSSTSHLLFQCLKYNVSIGFDFRPIHTARGGQGRHHPQRAGGGVAPRRVASPRLMRSPLCIPREAGVCMSLTHNIYNSQLDAHREGGHVMMFLGYLGLQKVYIIMYLGQNMNLLCDSIPEVKGRNIH